MEKGRILAIDDENNFTDVLKQYFEPRGYVVDVAEQGERGLEFLKQNDYDVVLLDFKMTGLDGREVMEDIKSNYPNIKIIFITAFTDSGRTKQRLMTEGAYAFLEKPVTSLKYLESLVNKAVGLDQSEKG